VDIDYIMFNITTYENAIEARVYNHTLMSDAVAIDFLNDTIGTIDKVRFNWFAVRNTTATIAFESMVRTQAQTGDWSSNQNATVRFLVTQNVTNEEYAWETISNETGMGIFDIVFPGTIQSYRLTPECTNGSDSSGMYPIQIPSITIFPDKVVVGSIMTVRGHVRYIYTNEGVGNATVTVSGPHVNMEEGITDRYGGFSIQVQAPIVVLNNLTIHIDALDSTTLENCTYIWRYDVIVDHTDPPPPPPPPYWLILIIVIGIASIGVALFFTLKEQD
jgi:hypothetical protein